MGLWTRFGRRKTMTPPTNELSTRAYQYLRSRNYTDELIREDGVVSRERGRHVLHGMEVKLHEEHLLWPCYSMGDRLSGLATANLEEKDYNFRRNPMQPWLPSYFASRADLDLIFRTQTVVLCEGVFDRVALKQAFYEPVMARLTRGVGRDLTTLLARYVKKVYLLFDNDAAGQLGARSARKRLELFATVQSIPYPGKDPAEFLAKVGLAPFRRHFEEKARLYF